MTEQYKYIPARLKSAVKGGYVTGAEDIDAGDGKNQQQVNNEVAQDSVALTQRVADLEAMEQIVIDGGEAQIATGSDFTNPDSAKRAKIPTVGAVLDGLNDGVYDVSKRFPAGGPNSDGKFTLDYILNNANTLIPTSRRHGGMTISFVHSYDNKYVRYTLKNDEWSININDWFFDELIDSGNTQSDLEVSDENLNVLMCLRNGEVETKNFNSAETPKQNESLFNDADLEVTDPNNNILLQLIGGNIRTRYFDSTPQYKNKIISILGDSISTFGTPGSTNELGTYCYSYYPSASCRYSENGDDSFVFDVNDTWWMGFINKVQAILGVNDSYRGSSISNIVNNKPLISSQERISRLGNNGTPNLILIFGGTNDIYHQAPIGTFDTTDVSDYTDTQIANMSVTTFADAYKAMLTRVLKTYPLSEVVCLLPTFATSTNYSISNLDNYIEIMKEACDFFGVKYIDLRTAGFNPFNTSEYLYPSPDGIHPNKKGMNLITNLVYKSLIVR